MSKDVEILIHALEKIIVEVSDNGDAFEDDSGDEYIFNCAHDALTKYFSLAKAKGEVV